MVSRRAALVFNPKSGRQQTAELIPRVLAILETAGFAVEPLPTRGPGDATQRARQAVREQALDVVFALGGDGTVREVAVALLDSEVALGPLPAGTTNVLAKALGIPPQPLAAAAAMVGYNPQRIDVGMAGETLFLMMISGGLDGAVMARQNAALKKRFGKAAVAMTGAREWWRYAAPEIDLRLDGQRDHASFFALCNIPLYGGSFRLAPQADCRDGRLDAVLFRGRGRFATLAFARDLWLGRHLERSDVVSFPFDEAEILGPPGVPLQIDGDVLPVELPLSIGVRRRALKILAPSPT